ncbi:MAG: 16S rRNA (uracil(1498)-N(3))-methyltransferase [Gammaproteobacteria bacterium]|nr:16S rRNA (uracil(1498)-N(3))-methyltransferase [Gammaproteobacteria bacterium]
MKRVYIDTDLTVGQTTTLPDSTFHYLFRVLRCRDNEQIIAFNGDSKDYIGQLKQLGKRSADIVVTDSQVNHKESPLHTILIQAASKGERMDIAIQKAVELGVNEIYPVQTEFSAVKLDAKRLAKKHQHWLAIIQSACEQCGRAMLPILHEVQPIADIIGNISAQKKIMLHPYPKHNNKIQSLQTLTHTDNLSVQSVAVLIGAEGGLSEQEVELAEQNEFIRLQLGQRILRTETATISALTLLQFVWGDYAK